MAGIRIDRCKNVRITGGYFEGNDIAVHATNSTEIYMERNQINDCGKGIVLDDCWDSEIKDTYINSITVNPYGFNNFRLKLLARLIRHYMKY
ncbi:right-handed parallel beta-helix repeat-containing protein [Acinetobacter johnsonii]|jgi:parallel beta-helix repeat protein|uniref:right-handed parallel beta-helix repeat-containing protein n=1 Tax=Acinetobacter TaxID=469 RepID=UPI003AF8C041